MSEKKEAVNSLPIKDIYPNPDQPRKFFSQERLKELAESILQNGLLEPIVVVERGSGFMIVAGERRWRASNMAGLNEVPVRIIQADARQVAELALLENLQREDLNQVEEALAYQGLMDMGLSMEEVAKKMGFKQTWRIRERLSLLNLDPRYRQSLVKGQITPSQGFELSRLPVDIQHILFEKIISGKADTYNKLRAMSNALLNPPPVQNEMFDIPREEEFVRVTTKYEKMLEKLCHFLRESFSEKDLKVLPRVVRGNVDNNLHRMDQAMSELKRIKKAMIQAKADMDLAV